MPVAAAHAAYARRDWQRVVDVVRRVDAPDASDLVLLAEACWWLGDSPGSMAVSEDLFQLLLRQPGGRAAAAERALRLSLEWFTRGDLSVGEAWLHRGRHLLEDLPTSPLHGYVVYCEAAGDLNVTGDPGPAAAAAERVAALADRFDDPVLRCFALALRGLASIRGGDTAAGFGWLDEAMLPALGGRLDPLWAGDLYCTVVHLCDELADLARMRAWTAALARWSTPYPQTFMFAGVTRIHELQLLAAEGQWDTVEAELGDRSADLVGAHGWLAGEGYYLLGDVRRLRGRTDGARAAYAAARRLGHDAQPGDALLQVAVGDATGALAQLRIALTEQDPLRRSRMLPAAVEVALACGETTYATAMVEELEATAAYFGTAGLRARAAQARADLLVAGGSAEAALPLLHEAAAVLREQRHRYAVGRVHESLAAAHRSLRQVDLAASSAATALAVYRDLGAAPDVARLSPHPHPGGLTGREVEVLALVRDGRTNREVAGALTISEKTVSRHLANIFTKIGVGSRTAAAAWAHEHHV